MKFGNARTFYYRAHLKIKQRGEFRYYTTVYLLSTSLDKLSHRLLFNRELQL